ncbi:MAG TPA: lysylphosphatidylglycerol synthase transmembrane domain-containing protein [Anaerolineales bacterium]|nr:lysylphosphatidylglycerol synthase transmembrane domain-containing protein [Anaerolineales bacterium]
MKRWQFWLGLLIGGLFLYFALQGLHLDTVWQVMGTANLWWLVPGIAVYFVGVWARAWRWHYLLKPIKAISTNTMFPIVTIGYMGNNILPARAGEVLRAFVLRKQQGVPVSASLATIVVERIFDGVVMLMFVIFNLNGLAQLSADSGFVGSIRSVALIGTLAFAVALGAFLLAAIYPHQSLGLYHRWVMPRLPGVLRDKLTPMLDSFWQGLESLRSPANILMVFITSIVIWLFETGKYWFVMHAFDFSQYSGGFFGLMLMNGVVNLATTLPGPPGHVGTFDGPGIAVLVAYGLPREIAVSYTLTLHAALWLPITLLGAYYMAREGLKWNEVQAEYQKLEHDAG